MTELAQKRKRAKEIQQLLKDEPALWEMIRGELKEISQTFGSPRRTRIEVPKSPMEFREEDYIVDEDSWVIVTRDGWTKRQKSFTDVASIRVRDDDRVGWVYRARARQTLTFFTDRGIAYTMRVNDLTMTTGHGEPIQKQFAFEDQEHIVGVVCHDARCIPDWTKHPQSAPRFVQRMLGASLDDDETDAPESEHGRNGNGDAAGAVLAAASLCDCPDGGRQGFAIRAGAACGGLDSQGPAGGAARPWVQGRPGGGSRGDGWVRECVPGDPRRTGADFPGHGSQHRRPAQRGAWRRSGWTRRTAC